MLKTAQNLRNVITLFHNPQSKASLALLNQVESKFQKQAALRNFDLEVNDKDPTADQLAAMKKYTPLLANVAKPADLPRPTLVSWFNGKVAVNNEERALAIVNAANAQPEAEL